MDTLKRSRTTITVVTAGGQVQTNEEAQVYVHDLYIFVTVQVLEDTPSVLSPQRSRATSDQQREADLLQNRELRSMGSSRTFIDFHHNFVLDIASAGSIYFFGPSKDAQQRGSYGKL